MIITVCLAGLRYQEMKAAEELQRLQQADAALTCLVATADRAAAALDCPEELQLDGALHTSCRARTKTFGCYWLVSMATQRTVAPIMSYAYAGGSRTLVGTLDVVATTRLVGEALIGKQRNAAYMHNVCTAACARRRGVGVAMVDAAQRHARALGALRPFTQVPLPIAGLIHA